MVLTGLDKVFHYQLIAPDTYEIKNLGFVSLYLLIGKEFSVLIDSGFGIGDLAGLVSALANGEIRVFNTHVHPDHSNGNRQFSFTAMGEREWQNHGLRWNQNLVNIASGQWNPAGVLTNQPYLANHLPEGFDPKTYNQMVALGLPEPDQLLSDGDIIDLGNRYLVVVHTPSHTTGSLCFWEPESGLLFAGDVLCKGADWLLNLKSRADFGELFQSYARLATLAAKVKSIYPAHGRKNLPGSFLTEVGEKMAAVQQGLLRGETVEHRLGTAVFYDFGGYGPLMAPGFSV